MNLRAWVYLLGGVYLAMLALAARASWRRHRTSDEFMFAGRSLGVRLGVLTYAAALFSAFTFQGMPDFFRLHGVGAWIFLAVSDGMMVLLIVAFGHAIRRRVRELGFEGVAGLMSSAYGSRGAGWAMFASSFIFLVPYVAIQIRGISIFLRSAFPDLLTPAQWAALIVLLMLAFSEIGGFRAIVFADAIQGLSLLLILWAIGLACVRAAGGWTPLWDGMLAADPALGSVPGPKGLFTPQFLIASAIAIVMIPVTQPQLTTRLVVMKSTAAMHRMAVAVGAFAMLVIFPTALVGALGAIRYAGVRTDQFLSGALLHDRAPWLGALALVGLFAAGLSTTNAQLFALGAELRSMLRGSDRAVMAATRAAILAFAIIVFGFSVVMSDQLVLLARTSFTGTSMMAPMVLGAVSLRRPPRALVAISTAAMLVCFAAQLGAVPSTIAGVRLDLLLYIVLAICSAPIFAVIRRREAAARVDTARTSP